MRVLITGASGFIGSRLVQALRQDDVVVGGLARSDSSATLIEGLDAIAVRGDLAAPDALGRAVREFEPTHVCHLAAEIATQKSAERIRRVNIDGTRALLDAVRELELEWFLFLSTVVRGEAHGALLTEDGPIEATTVYGKSKEAGDEMMFDAARDGLPAVVLRPSHVYGPGGWFAGLLADRFFRLPGDGQNLWDVVHVDDVVAACRTLLEHGEAGAAYHVVDDEPVTMRVFFDRAAEALGRRPWGHVPVWLAKWIAGADPIVSAVRSARSSNARLKELGWAPSYPESTEGLAATARELRAGAD